MRYNALGRTGLHVSELCFGTMTFGGGEGIWQVVGKVQQDEADALVKAALDGGINFFDTANVYSEGQSERILGQALRNLGIARDQVVIATKVYGRMGQGPNAAGASRGHILFEIERSLERLQLDFVDLYQIHGFDPTTPIEETIEALDQLVRRGMVRYVGLSNWAAWQVAKAVGIAERLGLARPVSLQAYYTLAGRDLERDIVPMLKSEGVGLMVWSPLAGGLLSASIARARSRAPTAAAPVSTSRRSTATAPGRSSTRSASSPKPGARASPRPRSHGCSTSRPSPASSSAPGSPSSWPTISAPATSS